MRLWLILVWEGNGRNLPPSPIPIGAGWEESCGRSLREVIAESHRAESLVHIEPIGHDVFPMRAGCPVCAVNLIRVKEPS